MERQMPYDDIAASAMGGKTVAVFCSTREWAKRHMNNIVAAAQRAGAERVTRSLARRCVTINGHRVHLILTNGTDGRGLSCDVVYLSESARSEYEYADVARAEVR